MNDQKLGSIRKECVVAVEDLLTAHTPELKTALEKLDGIATVNVGFKIDASQANPTVKTKISFYMNRVKDDRQTVIDDDQGKLF